MKSALTLVAFASIVALGGMPQRTSAAHAVIDLTPPASTSWSTSVVEAHYTETGHVLALVPVTFSVTARAYASGTIEVDYPWYSVFSVDKSAQIKSELKIAVDTALRKLKVGKVTAEGEPSRAVFSPEEADAVSTAMNHVLEENFGTK